MLFNQLSLSWRLSPYLVTCLGCTGSRIFGSGLIRIHIGSRDVGSGRIQIGIQHDSCLWKHIWRKMSKVSATTGEKLLFLNHILKHLDWLSIWILVKSFRTSTSCRCWQFVYDSDYSILCSSGVQKLLTDIVCHQQLNIHSVAFCVNYVIYDLSRKILSSVSLRLHFVSVSIAKCWQARVFWGLMYYRKVGNLQIQKFRSTKSTGSGSGAPLYFLLIFCIYCRNLTFI